MQTEDFFLLALIQFQTDVFLRRTIPALPPFELREYHLKPVEADSKVIARIRVVAPRPWTREIQMPAGCEKAVNGPCGVEWVPHMLQQSPAKHRPEFADEFHVLLREVRIA